MWQLLTAPEDLQSLRAGVLPPSLGQRVGELVVALEQGRAPLRVVGSTMEGAQRAALVRQDLAAGRVFIADGNVSFSGASWRADASYRFDGPAPWTLCFSDAILRRPLPGRQRLYGLPQSGLVVGAEAFPPDPLEAYRARVLATVELGADDLAALREGKSSPRVMALIRSGARSLRIVAWIVSAMIVMPLGFAVLVGMKQFALFELFGLALGWPILLVPVPPIGAFLAHREASRLAREQHAPILAVEGGTTRGVTGGKNSKSYIVINGETFIGNQQPCVRKLYEEVVPGWPTRGYVTAGTRTLVALEPLPLTGPAATTS